MACLHLVERKKERPGNDGAWRTGLKIQRLAEVPHRNQVLLIVLGTWRPQSARFLLQHNSCCLFWKEHGIFQRAVCLQVSWPLASWRATTSENGGICIPSCAHPVVLRLPWEVTGSLKSNLPFPVPSVRTLVMCSALWDYFPTSWTAAALSLFSHDMILVLFVILLNDESKEFRVSYNADQSRTG